MRYNNNLQNESVFKAILIASIILISSLFFFIPYITEKHTVDSIVKHSKVAVEKMKLTRAYYVKSVVKDIQKYAPNVTFNVNHEGLNGRLPLPSTTIFNLSQIFSDHTGIKYNLYSDYPFKNRQDRVLTAFQKEAINYTKENKDGVYIKRAILDGKEVVRVAVADYMTDQSCVSCHNQHPNRTWKRDKWKLGDIRGVLEVITPIEDELASSITMRNYILFSVGFTISLVLLYFFIKVRKREKKLLDTTDDLLDTVEYKNEKLYTLEKLLDNYVIHSKTNLAGTITHASQAFVDISGYSKEELINRKHSIIRHTDTEDYVFKELWATIEAGNIWKGELKNRKKDGTFYWVYAVISAEYDNENNITGYSAIRTDITAQKESQHLASHDTLTSLVNKKRFEEIATHAIQTAERKDECLAILFLDFDKFKNINDTLGHHAGDKLLVTVAQRMKKALREVDTIARVGGDEFIILLESIEDINSITPIITKLFNSIQEPMDLFGSVISITASMGISIYPNDGQNIEELIRNADNSMYYAKDMGRNSYQFFKEEIHTKLSRTLDISNALQMAIKNESFNFVYQPKYDLKTKKCTGAEILIRLFTENLGDIPPNEFIPIAEENGMINSITNIVFQEAINTFAQWKVLGLDIDTISINISSINLNQIDVIDAFINTIKNSSLSPSNIEFELTEHSIINNLDMSIEILNTLKQLGFLISIDDFGTGYSSISYLRDLPIDTVKIDKSFVNNIDKANKESTLITGTIIQLCKDLNYTVIAEGIETPIQEEILIELGADYGQGYFYSKPLTFKEFITFYK